MRIYAEETPIQSIFHGHSREAGLYRILNLTNGCVYIGETSRFGGRFLDHRKLLKKGTHRNWKIQSDYDAGSSLVFEVLTVIRDSDERHALEVEVIRSLFGDGCYNLVIDHTLPHPHSEATRVKIRAARSLQVVRKGYRHTDESKRRMSEAKRGKAPPASVLAAAIRANLGSKHSDERKAKIARSNTGKTPSIETRAKLRAAKLGRHLSEETKAKIAAGNRKPKSRSRSYESVVV